MNLALYISDILIPLVVLYIVGYGALMKSNPYDTFIEGAKEGLKTVVAIMPTLIGLMIAVGVLRSSGLMDMICEILGAMAEKIKFPKELIPLAIVRMFSSSAATGLVLDIYKNYGTDSYVGTVASIMASCTETIFYTMSVYYIAAKVTKTRWTLLGALISTFAGIIASVVIASIIC